MTQRGLVGVAAVLCVAVGAVALAAAQGGAEAPEELTVEVEGAMDVAVYCGGEETHFGKGTTVSLVPESATCEVEASLGPVIAVRAHLELAGELGGASRVRCRHEALELVCSAG